MTAFSVNLTEEGSFYFFLLKVVPVHSKEDEAMKKKNGKKMFVNAMTSVAVFAMIVAANSRCVFIYHQPKQPAALRKLRKF